MGCSFFLISRQAGQSFDNCDSEFMYKICLLRFSTIIVALCLYEPIGRQTDESMDEAYTCKFN